MKGGDERGSVHDEKQGTENGTLGNTTGGGVMLKNADDADTSKHLTMQQCQYLPF